MSLLASVRLFCASAALLLFAGGAAAQGAPSVSPPSGASRQNIKKLYKLFEAEPSARQVQKWTLRHHKLSPGRVNDLQRNARLKGLMPELEAGLDNMIGNTYTNMRDGLYPVLPSPPENPNPQNFKERTRQNQDQLTWRVRAVFSLDRLVFNSEMLDAMSLTSLQENLVREVTTLYYSRRRLLASLILSPPQNELEYFYELTRLEEITSQIDALCGGKFGPKAYDPTKNL